MMYIKWSEDETNRMQIKNKNGVTYLNYKAFEQIPWLVHGFSTRLGGVSEGVCASMNLSFSRGDKEEAVKENYKRISEAIGFDYRNIVASDQTHTTNVKIVSSKDCGNGVVYPKKFFDVDGLITNEENVILATYYADCVPLYLVDIKKKVIGLSHSGWRGTVGKIGAVTVKRMIDEYNCELSDIYAAIGPSICQACYEVSADVIEAFKSSFQEKYWEKLFYQKTEEKYHLNLWEANRIIFKEAGIEESHISMPGICTCCNPEFLFSHRASKGKRGNLAAFLGIKKTMEK